MNVRDIKVVLNKLGLSDGEILETKVGQLSICCPLAPWFHTSGKDSNPSMGIKYGGEHTIYHCFTCGEAGRLWSLVDSIGSLRNDPKLQALALEVLEKDQPNLETMLERSLEWTEHKPDLLAEIPDMALSEKVLSHFDSVELHEKPSDYLHKRRVPESDWVRFNLKYDRKQDRLVFPVYDFEGGLRGAVGRTLKGDKRKYFNYFNFESGHWFGGGQLKQDHPSVIIVEGFFCAMRGKDWANSQGFDIYCSFGSKLTDEQVHKLSMENKSVQIWFDNDDAGNQGWEKLNKKYGHLLTMTRAKLPVMTDVDTMTPVEFDGVLNAAKFSL